MHRKQANVINLAVLLAMLLSLLAGPGTVTQAAGNPSGAPAPSSLATFTSGNIVVYRVGTGEAASALVNTGNPVYLDEYTASGTPVQSIAMPVAADGSNRAFFASGTSTSEGLITRSVDGQYLVLTGYASTAASSISSTTGAAVNRVVGRVDWNGNIDTTTALADFASGSSPRSAVSTNGTDLWIAGGQGGVRKTALGETTSTQLSTALTNIRQVNIFDGQLYASDQSGSNYRLFTAGTGLPTSSGQTFTNLPGFPTSTGSPYGFFFADLSTDVAGMDTLYVADDSAGIQKYSLVGGNWTLTGTADGTDYRGLTGSVSGATVTLFIVSSNNISKISNLDMLVDSGGYNTGFSSTTKTNLATAAANTAFRGVALAPVAPVDNAPTVVNTTPANGAANVALNTDIQVNFSESVDTSAAAFTLTCGTERQAFAFTGSGSSYTLDPENNLPLDTECTLTITANQVTDQDGDADPLAADSVIIFHTTTDLTPTVSSTNPANGAVNVAVGSDIQVTFSEDVTAPSAAFQIVCDTDSQPFTLSGSGDTYTLNPDSNLPYSQTCTVTVLAGQVSDIDGTVVNTAADYSWSFTTTFDPDVIMPIADARSDGAGWTGTLQGNVTVPTGIYRSNAFVIQDDTGGMYVYTSPSITVPQMALGDVIKIKGTIKNYSGLLETDPTISVTRISSGTAPAPAVTTTGGVASTQGKLIVVEGTATWTTTPPTPGASDFSFNINDGSGSVQVYVDKDTAIDMQGFVAGQRLRVIGFSGNYNGAQVMPRYQTDIIDLRPPTVTGTVPSGGATDVSLYKPLRATFNRSMDPNSLTTDSFTLTGPSGAVAGSVSYTDATHTAIFTPDAALGTQTAYTATLTTSVKDPYGTALEAAYTWSFTTGDTDSTAPTIVSRSPVAGAVDVPASSGVTITFSEDLQPGSLDLNHFSLSGPYGQVPVTLSYNADTYTVTLTPQINLLYSKPYTVKVTGATSDYAGNTLGSDDTWTFTTMAEPPMQTFFGDLHNHTGYSDGSGTPAQALAAGEAAGFDFMAISDHSYAIDDTEWANTLTAVETATDADFVGLRGFEYTQGAEGHINVWNSTRHAVRANTGCTFCDYTPNLEAGSTVQGFYPWLVSATNTPLDSAGMVMQFNHPGWINFNDWFYHPEVSGIARLNEVGNGYGSSYVFAEEEYLRSLDYGWKLGATNNSDTHSTYWGVNTDHRTGVLMPELTKAALLEGLRQRRTFATEDKNFSLQMKANGAWMGSEIVNTGSIAFEINGADADGELAQQVALITDQGKVVASTHPEQSSFDWQPLVNVSTGVHYFYVKVTQADGDIIVTSPIWTLGSEDISITDIRIQPTIPTIYSPSLLTARITNRVAESRTVKVTIKVGDTPLGPAQQITVPANGDGFVNFEWQPTTTGDVTITAQMEDAPAGDNPDDNSASLNLTVTDEHLPLLLIDAGHGNVNATGDEMRAYIDDLSAHHYNVLKNLDELTASDLDPDVVKLLIITAPQTAYTTEEQNAIANFVKAGGSLWIGGLADYTGSVSWAATVADRENAILDTIETVTGQQINMRMNDDEVIDGNTNNGYVFGVVWQDFPSANTTGIGLNVESVATWSLSSLRGRTVNDPLTADTPGVQIVMQGDLDEGYTADKYHNPSHTNNTDADKAGDAYMYNPGWVYPAGKPADAIPLPGAAVTQLENGAGRIMLYGDSNDPFTTFAYTAGDGKQNELFNLQSIMWLLSEPLQKSTIAEARAQTVEDQPNHLNELVWVEGKITAAYGEFFNVLYVQDETGGITVHAPAGDIDPKAFTRGTTVRVIGTVDTYAGDTEVQFFEAEMVQVIGASTGEPTPRQFTTQQATLETNEGWLTTVIGAVTGKIGTDTLLVDDGTGPVRVFLDGYNGAFSDIAVNDHVQVVGLASEDGEGQRIRVRNYKLHTGIADDVVVLDTVLQMTKTVSAPAKVDLGSKLTYTIELKNVNDAQAEGVILSDILPEGVTFDAFVENSKNAQLANGTLTWTGTILPSEQVRVVFTVTLNQDDQLYGDTITNTASFTSSNAGTWSDDAAFIVREMFKSYMPIISKK